MVMVLHLIMIMVMFMERVMVKVIVIDIIIIVVITIMKEGLQCGHNNALLIWKDSLANDDPRFCMMTQIIIMMKFSFKTINKRGSFQHSQIDQAGCMLFTR